MASKPVLGFKDFERLARSIGTFKEDASQDSCRRFKSWNTNSFKFYLDLAVTDYNITEDTHRSLFLKSLDEGIRMRLKNVVLPREITDFNVEQLIEKTQMFFQRKCNAIVERVKLHRRIQREEEAVQKYAKGLKRIATNCSFKAGEYEDRLRDIFVAGLKDDSTLQKMYEKEDLLMQTLDEVILLAKTLEGARDSVMATREAMTESQGKVCHLQGRKYVKEGKPYNKRQQARRGFVCFQCGEEGHYQWEYTKKTAKNQEKSLGFRRGKVAKPEDVIQRTKKVQQARNSQMVDLEESWSQEDEESSYCIDSVTKNVYCAETVRDTLRKLEVKVRVDDCFLTFRVDTGTDVSLMDEIAWNTLGQPKLSKEREQLRNASGQIMRFKGMMTGQVRFCNNLAPIQFYVKQGTGSNLLGMVWVKKDGMATVCIDYHKAMGNHGGVMLTESSEIAAPVEKLLQQFSELFTDELGCCSEIVGISVQPEADLKVCPFRRPPMHLRAQIEKELERNVKNDVLEPVNIALCAFPTANIVKPNGDIRICGDFKPLNRIMVVDQYPIPIPAEMFSSLAGGKMFSKIDLKDAYNQLRVDKESQKWLLINTHKGLFKYRQLPFGISSAPAIFQRTIAKVLKGVRGICIYMDDILISGKDKQEHMQNLSQVFQKLQHHGFRIRRDK